MKKHTYRSVEVQLFDVASLLGQIAPTSKLVVAIDVAKNKMVAVIAAAQGQILQTVKWQQPRQTQAFVTMVQALGAEGRCVEAVMEPTGTYGDPLRNQLQLHHVPVFLASAHFVRNLGLVYDGVPSKHDAKDAAVLAWMHSQGKTKPWPVLDEARRTLRAIVDERDQTRAKHRAEVSALGRLAADFAFPRDETLVSAARAIYRQSQNGRRGGGRT